MFLHKYFGDGSPMTELDDIKQNLLNVLRTRRGTGYFLQNFGLTKIGFRTAEEMVSVLSEEITENVKLYEPRVDLLQIEEDYADDGTRASLIVHLRRRDTQERLNVVVDLRNYTLRVADVVQRPRRT
jgi:phage baseplate assembly protein W